MAKLMINFMHGKEDPQRATLAFAVGNVAAYANQEMGVEHPGFMGSKRTLRSFYRKTFSLWRLLVAAILIVPWIMGQGATPAYAAGTHQVPFGAIFSGAVAFGSNGAPVFNGNGIATYLGRFTSEGYVVFTAELADCAGGVPNDNFETLTAANGDSLTIVSHDVACPIAQNVYHGSGHWEVLGGTGRFSGAGGQGTFDGQSDFNRGVFSIQLIGTITSPSGK